MFRNKGTHCCEFKCFRRVRLGHTVLVHTAIQTGPHVSRCTCSEEVARYSSLVGCGPFSGNGEPCWRAIERMPLPSSGRKERSGGQLERKSWPSSDRA